MSLTGEVVGEFLDGVPCSTSTLDHLSSLDFSSGNSARFDGHDEEGVEDGIEKKIMGACFKVTKVKSYQYSILFFPPGPSECPSWWRAADLAWVWCLGA